MSAKDENGEYTVSTRFGKGEKLYHDKKWTRPVDRKEYLHRIEVTRLSNKWDWEEFGRNSVSLGLKVKPLGEYSDDELKIVLDDFEKYRMILFE